MRCKLERRKKNRNWEMGRDLEKPGEQLRGSGEAGVEGIQAQLPQGLLVMGKIRTAWTMPRITCKN